MKHIRFIHLSMALLLGSLLLPQHALAHLVPRADRPAGWHVGVTPSDLGVEWSNGPLNVGGSVFSRSQENLRLSGMDPSLRMVVLLKKFEHSALGAVFGGRSEAVFPINELAEFPKARVYIGDAGLTWNYRLLFPAFWGGNLDMTQTVAYSLMLDSKRAVRLGPNSGVETALRLTPQFEALLGVSSIFGSYVIGFRAKL